MSESPRVIRAPIGDWTAGLTEREPSVVFVADYVLGSLDQQRSRVGSRPSPPWDLVTDAIHLSDDVGTTCKRSEVSYYGGWAITLDVGYSASRRVNDGPTALHIRFGDAAAVRLPVPTDP